jgi:hypothetical protein
VDRERLSPKRHICGKIMRNATVTCDEQTRYN